MQKIHKILLYVLPIILIMGSIVSCGKTDSGDNPKSNNDQQSTVKSTDTDSITTFTFFGVKPRPEINEKNDVRELIAKKTGVRLMENWLSSQSGQSEEEAVENLIATGDYPDFIDGGDGSQMLYEQGVLIPWDDYLESGKYPNLEAFYTKDEWDMFRREDGHIYWCNVFQNTKGASTETMHNDEAFWIQARVLEWDHYPKIETLDQYFDLLERYIAAHPTDKDPQGNTRELIAYTCLCETGRFFCIENAPQFLDGYPNDGSVMVDYTTDPSKPQILDYNTTDTARKYFEKLNEEYRKGIVDPEFATQNYDEYLGKLADGIVLGMCDQYWDFMDIIDTQKSLGVDEMGCSYIPLGLTIEEGMDNRWHTYGDTLNVSSGIGVTTSCQDPELAFSFLNAMLDQDIHNLRFWGVEGEDYLVDENGLFYRTDEIRKKVSDDAYKKRHLCQYGFMPQYGGTSDDSINANFPNEQPSEFIESLPDPVAACFEAYKVKSYPQMIGSIEEIKKPWFPMWSYSNSMTDATKGGEAWNRMNETKKKWLPLLVMSGSFDSDWDAYMDEYAACNPEDFLQEMQDELNRRAGKANNVYE